MATLRWKDGLVVSIRLRDGSFVLAQLLKSPYIAFFDNYSDVDRWDEDAAEKSSLLFACSVLKGFLTYSTIHAHPEVRSKTFESLPHYWIEPFHGSRRVTVWEGTPKARTLILLSERPGGRLIEEHMDVGGVQKHPVIMPSIPLDDDATIDRYEKTGLRNYPALNERLYLCKMLGRPVDPEKDLLFNRPIRDEYENYVGIMSMQGVPEDWGYSSVPPNDNKGAKSARSGKKCARIRSAVLGSGFPFESVLDARHKLEDRIEKEGVGTVVHARSGSDFLEVDVEMKSARAREGLKRILDDMGLAGFVTVSFD